MRGTARPSGRPAAAGLLVVVALAVLDAAWGPERILAATVLLGPFIAALSGAVRATAAVGLLAVLAAALSGWWNDNLLDADYWVRLDVVVIGTGFAVLGARSRERLALDRERFRLLTAAAALGDTVATVDETVGRVTQLLVPAFADVCLLDVEQDGERRRLAAATSGDRAPVLDDAPDDARLEVPLRARSRELGRLTLARDGGYDTSEREFAGVLAGRVALALDNAGLFSEVESLEARMSAALGALGEAITIQDTQGRFVYANAAAARAFGFMSPEELAATPPAQAAGAYLTFTEDGAPLRIEDLPSRRVLAGEVAEPLLLRTVDRATGEERWRLTKATAVHDVRGRPTLAVNVIEDVTDVKRAEVTQRFLAEVGAVLTASLDVRGMLERVAGLAVPRLADRCTATLAEDAGGDDPLVAQVLLDGVAQRVDHGEGARPRSTMVVPMTGPGGVSGVLTFHADGSGRSFTAADLALAEEVGRRTGTAVETARLYAERTRIAQTLQLSLLPDELPRVPGFELASLYRPAGEETFVGGDFYDAFAVDDGWMLLVGDVTGRGAQAAALTGEARYTLRTAATLLGDPLAAVEHLNRALVAQPELPICTVAVLLLREHADGRTTATVVCAGHPPPLLVRGGAVEPLCGPGPMVGAWEDGRWAPRTSELHAGDVLVLYTDGVTDTVGDGGRFGEERLAATVAEAVDADDAVERIRAALRTFERGSQADDTAVVVARRTSDGRHWSVPADPAGVVAVRTEVAAFARAAGAAPATVDDVRLAVSEALTNVVLHAYRDGRSGDVDVRARPADGELEVVVEDRGVGLVPRPDSPGIGVGLPLIATLAAASEVVERPGGGTTVRMRFPLGGD